MPRSPKILALALFAAGLSTAAQAQEDWSNSALYNGYGATSQNQASNYSMRDRNGNLTMVNGRVTSSSYSAASGAPEPMWRMTSGSALSAAKGAASRAGSQPRSSNRSVSSTGTIGHSA